MEVLNRQKELCMRVRLGPGGRAAQCAKKETASHGECWGEVASRSGMLGMHRRQGPGSA